MHKNKTPATALSGHEPAMQTPINLSPPRVRLESGSMAGAFGPLQRAMRGGILMRGKTNDNHLRKHDRLPKR